MAKVTNHSKATRVINVRVKLETGEKLARQVVAAGQSVDCDPVQTESFKAAVKSGALSFSDKQPQEPDPQTKTTKK